MKKKSLKRLLRSTKQTDQPGVRTSSWPCLPHCTSLPRAAQHTVKHSLHRCAIVVSFVLSATACATPIGQQRDISFDNPPAIGSYLSANRELFACENEPAASYMVTFGFVHPLCYQLIDIEPNEIRVENRTRIELKEGPMWLLQVQRDQKPYYVPIPWHNWL